MLPLKPFTVVVTNQRSGSCFVRQQSERALEPGVRSDAARRVPHLHPEILTNHQMHFQRQRPDALSPQTTRRNTNLTENTVIVPEVARCR